MPNGSYQNGLGAKPRGKMGTHGDGKKALKEAEKAAKAAERKAAAARPEKKKATPVDGDAEEDDEWGTVTLEKRTIKAPEKPKGKGPPKVSLGALVCLDSTRVTYSDSLSFDVTAIWHLEWQDPESAFDGICHFPQIREPENMPSQANLQPSKARWRVPRGGFHPFFPPVSEILLDVDWLSAFVRF